MKLSERDIKVAIVSGIIAMIISVVALDYKGYIYHSSPADKNVIDRFKLLSLDVNSTTEVSPKSSNKEAFCVDGYLLIRPEKNNSGKTVAGVLVDEKNRGIPCSRDLPSPGQ
ncbi:hypothetical protein [Oceaniserpentilla sp. 4NH20-0058]|uniref:hypothetical protein n=1 Tax=Oceaniserpentilla sp. 4NH20-0058 TaxID=3127660 RepID=UPI0033401A6F